MVALGAGDHRNERCEAEGPHGRQKGSGPPPQRTCTRVGALIAGVADAVVVGSLETEEGVAGLNETKCRGC